MKDNRRSPFINDISRNPSEGRSDDLPKPFSYVRFNHFHDSLEDTGTYFEDLATSAPGYEISLGDRDGNTGNFSPTTGSIKDLDIYGQSVFSDERFVTGEAARVVMRQAGLSMPLSSDAVFVSKKLSDTYNGSSDYKLQIMLKMRLRPGLNQSNLSVITLASGGDPAQDVASLVITNDDIEAVWESSSSSKSSPSANLTDKGFVTVFMGVGTFNGTTRVESWGVFDSVTGEELSTRQYDMPHGESVTGSPKTLTNPAIYIGYGHNAPNNNFHETDFAEVDIAEIALFDEFLTLAQMRQLVEVTIPNDIYKSGFNNRSPRRVQQLLDARTVYPQSADPLSPASNSSTLAFDDQKTKIFGEIKEGTPEAIAASTTTVMFPEMLPAAMFSGSSPSRGAEGDVRSFYRDNHHTEYDKRIFAKGTLRPGLSHKETELFNIAKRSSPVTIGEDTDVLGGTIQPFDDSHPLAGNFSDNSPASTAFPGFDQRLVDHVAIVIDITPTEETTIGVERDSHGETTGRVTSMAYFNFKTKTWETSGKNNDFIVPGAVTVGTGSASLGVSDVYQKQVAIDENAARHIFTSASVGFAGTSGFTIWQNAGENALSSLAQRGAPTSNYGFPTARKYEAEDAQTIDMSDYIDSPFILEKVSFEFAGAIEDSGPHSLGYMQDLPAVGEDANKRYPVIKFSIADGNQLPYTWSASYVDAMNVRAYARGEFINGSPVFQEAELGLTRAPGENLAFTHASAAAVASILLGRNEVSRNYAGAHPDSAGPSDPTTFLTVDGPKFDIVCDDNMSEHRSGERAKVILPTAIGPRGAQGSTPGGVAQSVSRRQSQEGLAVPYIPVLAGGLNGIVTGSDETTLTSGPWIYPQFVANGPGNEDLPLMEPGSGDKLLEKGGVPFWRADTFFLMRQSRTPIETVRTYRFEVQTGAESLMSPTAPYAIGPQFHTMQSRRIKGSGYSSPMGQHRRNLYLKTGFENPQVVSFTSTSDTTRELITFGQVTHYGYTAAADSYVDTVLDSDAYDSNMSGSQHNAEFREALFDTSKVPAEPKSAILFGQAIKIANQVDYGNRAIPSNVDSLISDNPSTNTSMMSDAPDTFQGQYSFVAGERNAGFGEWSLISHKSDPNSRYPGFRSHAGRPRYYDAGRMTPDFGDGMTPEPMEQLISLDTWAGQMPTKDNTLLPPSGIEITGDHELYMKNPQGSGFSIISTPAYLCKGRSGEEQEWFGDFTVVAKSREDRSSANVYPPDAPPKKNWLDAGLRREANVYCAQGFQHEGVNPDYPDNWSGFTLMTASTIWRPYASPGRESASSPLVANVYKRQYLNYFNSIRIDAPVKSTLPTSLEPPGYWVTTSENVLFPTYDESPHTSGAAAHATFRVTDNDGTNTLAPGDSTIAGSLAYKRGKYAKRFHQRNSHLITRGGYTSGRDADNISNTRNQKSAPSSTPANVIAAGPLPFGVRPDTRPSYGGADFSWMGEEDFARISEASILSGSVPEETSRESMYLLKPGDKLVLGVQPALPGWNPGSGLPNNRHSSKYGIWDYRRSKDLEKAVTHDLDDDGNDIRYNSFMNLEDPYEPCHGLTMLQKPSKLILYGTLVRNGKHYSPSSGQKLVSVGVHEALHYDNPVLDQFLTDASGEYAGSNLAHHITGSMLEGKRGVAGSLSQGSLFFSGSFQRFTRATEDSQVFFDSLMHDPFEIAQALSGSTDPGAADAFPFAVINLHQPSFGYVTSSAGAIDGDEDYAGASYAFAHGWADSFPFEEKLSGVSRSINNSLRFSGKATALYRLNPPFAKRKPGAQQGDSNVRSFFSIVNPNVTDGGSIGSVLSDYYSPGFDVATIGNMSDVRQATFNENGGIAPTAPDSLIGQRTFFASMIGYGRQNRKQLDYVTLRYFSDEVTPDASFPARRGIAYFGHPAGFKYGYMNCSHVSPSAVHRADHYGQFRDMLEQRLYSKVYSFGDEYKKRGESEAAVTALFVDADGQPIDDATKTSCLNLSKTMASTKPFIEGEVLREIIINSESVTIE